MLPCVSYNMFSSILGNQIITNCLESIINDKEMIKNLKIGFKETKNLK